MVIICFDEFDNYCLCVGTFKCKKMVEMRGKGNGETKLCKSVLGFGEKETFERN